jgi:hypothetical protein
MASSSGCNNHFAPKGAPLDSEDASSSSGSREGATDKVINVSFVDEEDI